jgi:hypothetical protein
MAAFKQLAAAAPENLSPGQAPGSGTGVQSPAPGASESAAAGGGATQTAGGVATTSSANDPAQQTTNAAGRVSQSFLGLALSIIAAFLVL